MRFTLTVKQVAYLPVVMSCLWFGLAGSSTAQSTKDKIHSQGTFTSTARQLEAPAFLREATFGIVTDECTPPSRCIALQRIVLRNKGAAPITSYRLGWVVVFADPKKPAEVHIGNPVPLYQVIGPNQEREFNDNLAPVVQLGPTIRMISYFIAEIQQEGSNLFTQNLNRIASDEYDEFWTRSKRN